LKKRLDFFSYMVDLLHALFLSSRKGDFPFQYWDSLLISPPFSCGIRLRFSFFFPLDKFFNVLMAFFRALCVDFDSTKPFGDKLMPSK